MEIQFPIKIRVHSRLKFLKNAEEKLSCSKVS